MKALPTQRRFDGDHPGISHAERAISPDGFLDRELSQLESFTQLLDEAEDESQALVDRILLLALFAEKLDEFYGTNAAILSARKDGGTVGERNLEAITPAIDFHCGQTIDQRLDQLVSREYRCWRRSILPALNETGIRFVHGDKLASGQKQSVKEFFADVFPLLTPMAIDLAHPQPVFRSQHLYLGATLSRRGRLGPDRLFGVVEIPSTLNRIVPLPSTERSEYLFLEEAIAEHLPQLFGGYDVLNWTVFRFTRDSRVKGPQEQGDDPVLAAQSRLAERRRSPAVRLEISDGTNPHIVANLLRAERLTSPSEDNRIGSGEVHFIPGPIDLRALVELKDIVAGRSQWKHAVQAQKRRRGELPDGEDMFARISRGDVLLHHPFQSFAPVVDLLNQAARDPHVLSISQTLYRIRDDNPLVAPLVRAAENGKQVTAMVELNARYDEQDNIKWAREMNRRGVHVVYGFEGVKIHCKLSMIVRQEPQGQIKRYAHLATGNYHHTVVPYTDLGLLTSDEDITADVAGIFNMLTGYVENPHWRKLAVAPYNLHDRTVELIEEQTARALAGQPARIFAKLNAVIDPRVIESLHQASQAGVPIELVVRGVCTLRPQLSGISENIRVRKIADKFYEHSRLFVFGPDDSAQVFLASADWMPRNFQRRVEVMFPIEDAALRDHLLTEVVPAYLRDTLKVRFMTSQGTYQRGTPGESQLDFRCQEYFQGLYRRIDGNRPRAKPVDGA